MKKRKSLNGEARELKRLVDRYPKLTFKIVVAICLMVASAGGFWMRSAYGQFQMTTNAVDALTKADSQQTEEIRSLREKHVDINKKLDDQREDIREIRSDVKKLLQRVRPAP